MGFFIFIFICIAVLALPPAQASRLNCQIDRMIYNFLSFKDPFREKDVGLVLIFCAPSLLRVFFPKSRIGHSDITKDGWEKVPKVTQGRNKSPHRGFSTNPNYLAGGRDPEKLFSID